jgi:hypothetical protein
MRDIQTRIIKYLFNLTGNKHVAINIKRIRLIFFGW